MAEKISKQEAVRRALSHFGNDAKPSQMKPWIKEELGVEMSTDHISTAKGDILRKAGKKPSAKKAGRPPSATQKTPPAPVTAAAAKRPAIPLEDILYVKKLLGRVGPEQLHTLIDAFSK